MNHNSKPSLGCKLRSKNHSYIANERASERNRDVKFVLVAAGLRFILIHIHTLFLSFSGSDFLLVDFCAYIKPSISLKWLTMAISISATFLWFYVEFIYMKMNIIWPQFFLLVWIPNFLILMMARPAINFNGCDMRKPQEK